VSERVLSERALNRAYERIDHAGHWIPLGAPERLNQLFLDFL